MKQGDSSFEGTKTVEDAGAPIADFGHPLLEDAAETHLRTAAADMLGSALSYYRERLDKVMERPEAAGLLAQMKEEAKNPENVLYRMLLNQ